MPKLRSLDLSWNDYNSEQGGNPLRITQADVALAERLWHLQLLGLRRRLATDDDIHLTTWPGDKASPACTFCFTFCFALFCRDNRAKWSSTCGRHVRLCSSRWRELLLDKSQVDSHRGRYSFKSGVVKPANSCPPGAAADRHSEAAASPICPRHRRPGPRPSGKWTCAMFQCGSWSCMLGDMRCKGIVSLAGNSSAQFSSV